ncbi:hypothetical protein T4A_12181 [Trichinella pseudospiralis]|uniref:Transmembrane protein n=1 Tax=Trichinella pseudospiralis TaxID=6337 RepID=A0A0V1E9J7_TRIPS|nr:hypothetical protein T4A_12181 [Trichinella pseudospiralis]
MPYKSKVMLQMRRPHQNYSIHEYIQQDEQKNNLHRWRFSCYGEWMAFFKCHINVKLIASKLLIMTDGMTGRLFICFCILVIVLLLGLKIQARTTIAHRRHSKHRSSQRRNIAYMDEISQQNQYDHISFKQLQNCFRHSIQFAQKCENGKHASTILMHNAICNKYLAKMDLFDLFCPKPIPVQMLIN